MSFRLGDFKTNIDPSVLERDANARAARASETEASRRIAAVEAENRRLREELADAEQKLEAITTIERSIRE